MREDQINPEVLERPLEKTIILQILSDPPLSLIKEVRGETNIFEKTLKFLKLKKNKTLNRKYRIIELNLTTAPPRKIFDYFNLQLKEINENSKQFENTNNFEDGFLSKAYQDSIVAALYEVSYSDELFRLILDNIKLEDFDFIPHLNASQRRIIIEAFYEVNPILGEAQKKAQVMMEGVRDEAITNGMKMVIQELEQTLQKTKESQNLEN
jgi:hypothetical protein